MEGPNVSLLVGNRGGMLCKHGSRSVCRVLLNGALPPVADLNIKTLAVGIGFLVFREHTTPPPQSLRNHHYRSSHLNFGTIFHLRSP